MLQGEHTLWGTIRHRSVRGLERTICACARRFGFKEAELCSGLNVVMKQGSFYDCKSQQILSERKEE